MIEYTYHCVFQVDGQIMDLCVDLDYPMISSEGISDIRRRLQAYVRLKLKNADAGTPVFLATPKLIGYKKDGQTWEPQIEGSTKDIIGYVTS